MSQKYSEEQWEELLREYREGGMTAKARCKSKGVSENALYYWQKKLRDKTGVKEKENQEDFKNNPDVFDSLLPWGNLPENCYVKKSN